MDIHRRRTTLILNYKEEVICSKEENQEDYEDLREDLVKVLNTRKEKQSVVFISKKV